MLVKLWRAESWCCRHWCRRGRRDWCRWYLLGLVGPIWLRFVSKTGVFDDDWADNVIYDSEMQREGNNIKFTFLVYIYEFTFTLQLAMNHGHSSDYACLCRAHVGVGYRRHFLNLLSASTCHFQETWYVTESFTLTSILYLIRSIY
jgi:hypothetical protein